MPAQPLSSAQSHGFTGIGPRELLIDSTSHSVVPANMSEFRARLLPALVLPFFAALFWFTSHHELTPAAAWVKSSPVVISGDEPHYLLVVNSLLRDGDIDLANNYRRALQGGLDLGIGFQRQEVDHHTLVVEARSHRSFRWQEVHGQEGVGRASLPEVSAHPMAFPALIAAMLWPFRVAPANIEHRSIEAVMLLAWLVLVSTYFAGRRSGLSPPATVAALTLLGLCSPFLAYSRAFFAEAPLALAMILGLWAMQVERYALAAVGVCVAIWLKPNFGVIGIGWAVERYFAGNRRAAAMLAGVSVFGSVPIIVINELIAYRPLIGGAGELVFARGWGSLARTLFSVREGLFPFVLWVPWVLLGLLPRQSSFAPATRTLLRQIAFPAALHLLVLGLAGFSAGYCYGPRYWIPLLPWFALAAVHVARARGRTFRAALAVCAIGTAVFAVPASVRYRYLFSEPPTKALAVARPPKLSDITLRVDYEPEERSLSAEPEQSRVTSVRIFNHSSIALVAGDSPWGNPAIALSYHLLDASGRMLEYDGPRSFLRQPIPPGGNGAVELTIRAPARPGTYRLAIDLVWEGACWFGDRGSPPALVELQVR